MFLRVLVKQGLAVDKHIVDVSNLDRLVGVELSFVFEIDMDDVWVLYQDFISMLDVLSKRLVSVVQRNHAEVILEVHEQEAHRYVLLLGEMRNNLGT